MSTPKPPRRKGALTGRAFDAIVQVTKTSEPSRTAARMVLVDGYSVSEAARVTGLLRPSVSRSVNRLRRRHALLSAAYRRVGRHHVL